MAIIEDEQQDELVVAQVVERATSIDNSELQKKVEVLEAIQVRDKQRIEELSTLVDRMQNDFDNFRKRTREEAKNLKTDGICEAIEKVLPTVDVMSKAIPMIKDEKIAEGIRMIQQQLEDTLKGFGVVEIEALGKAFNPKLHNAIMQSKTKDPEKSGLVTEVFQKGYAIGDKVIRHATVKVAK